MLILSDGERISMIRSAVLTQYTRVTDRQTDGRTDGRTDGQTELAWHIRAIAYMLSRVKIGQYLTKLCVEHLGFTFLAHPVRFAGHPTLEPNTTSIGKPVAKLSPFLYIQDGRQPPSWISYFHPTANSASRSADPENSAGL